GGSSVGDGGAAVAGTTRGAQPLKSLGQDGRAVLVAAPLLHIGQVRLVRLVLRRSGRVGLVLTGRETAAGAVPPLRNGRVTGEAGARDVHVGAPERDPYTWSCLAALGLPHRTGADTAATDRVATTHG